MTILELPLPPDGLPVYSMTTPTIHSGDFLATLHQWGELPDIVPLISVADMLAVLLKQNRAALAKILRGAIESGDMPFWGWKAQGQRQGWVNGHTPWWRPIRKVSRSDAVVEPGTLAYTLEIDDQVGRVHWEAMAIRPADAVGLLVKRGRKVPAELLDFLPPAEAPPTTAPADQEPAEFVQQPAARRILRKAALIAELEKDWPSIRVDLAEASRPGNEDLRAANIQHGKWDLDMVKAWGQARGKGRQTPDPTALELVWRQGLGTVDSS